ncbi:MAG TPA: hypothetical protein VH619_05970 [Verrucomicrobiae bacterium]|nr:hypothetical protein [Verrucomicrobiae bacterium]
MRRFAALQPPWPVVKSWPYDLAVHPDANQPLGPYPDMKCLSTAPLRITIGAEAGAAALVKAARKITKPSPRKEPSSLR